MSPKSVYFKDYDLEIKSLSRNLLAPTPPHWIIHKFFVEESAAPLGKSNILIGQINRWLAANIVGRWTIHNNASLDGNIVIIAFEEANDAVMFRLMEGETAWKSIS